jgi:GTP-binding protein
VENNQKIRNIAIIAHVDHGKTTLVDGMLRQSGTFRDNQHVRERVMDSNDLERERGITILSKNTSITYQDYKINIVDTPGHADFGGEVERVLKMVDGVLLLVDAFEGTMPQTRFVLRKALALDLIPIVVINKIDRPEARPQEVLDEVLELFMELGVSDHLLDFPVIYASARDGVAIHSLEDEKINLQPLFEGIIEKVPAPTGDPTLSLQFLVSSIDYDEYVGRIAIGRIERGSIKAGDSAVLAMQDGKFQNVKISRVYGYSGLKRTEIENAYAGDIIAVAGMSQINVGETICDRENPEPLPFVDIEQPTISMEFIVNDSPFAGREGDFVTSRQLRERLFKELQSNISLKVEETDSTDSFKVSGRGELHLSILIETMRREGYEFQVSKPKVINKKIDGEWHEPIEHLIVDIPEDFMGVVMEKLGTRKGEMINMAPSIGGYTRIEFKIPARGLIGYRSEFLTDTKGNGIMNHLFDGYQPYKGEISGRQRGAMAAWQTGESVTYGLYNAQERGTLFIDPGTPVYEGMVVGENARKEEIVINVCKKKHVTNIRASGSDDALRLVPPRRFSLEQSLEFIEEDELVEVTPKSVRIRKKILNTDLRSKSRPKN